MYVLEIRTGNKGRNKNSNFRSFENFEFLMREKVELEKNGNKCLVYKVENNGKEVSRLSDKNEYVLVSDLDKEWRKGWKQYCNIRKVLMERGILDFYVDNDILYIKNENSVIEVEMVRKTPRYEVRRNGVLIYDKETSQNDIVDKLFVKNGSRLKKVLRKDLYYC